MHVGARRASSPRRIHHRMAFNAHMLSLVPYAMIRAQSNPPAMGASSLMLAPIPLVDDNGSQTAMCPIRFGWILLTAIGVHIRDMSRERNGAPAPSRTSSV